MKWLLDCPFYMTNSLICHIILLDSCLQRFYKLFVYTLKKLGYFLTFPTVCKQYLMYRHRQSPILNKCQGRLIGVFEATPKHLHDPLAFIKSAESINKKPQRGRVCGRIL